MCDFDGVITDNRVWVDQDGTETVAAYRSDSVRVKELRAIGIEVMILSSEPNRVVEARARKMGVEAIHGIALQDKGRVMREVLEQKKLKAENVIYVGNDINDLPCFEVAGWSVAVADAYPEVIRAADHVLSKSWRAWRVERIVRSTIAEPVGQVAELSYFKGENNGS